MSVCLFRNNTEHQNKTERTSTSSIYRGLSSKIGIQTYLTLKSKCHSRGAVYMFMCDFVLPDESCSPHMTGGSAGHSTDAAEGAGRGDGVINVSA